MSADVSGTLTKLQQHSERIFKRGVLEMERQLDRKVPRKTGQLYRSGRVIVAPPGPVLRARFEYPDYGGKQVAEWTDKGTRRHVIYPRNARALRFKVRGKTVFAKYVFHPGTKGTRWWSNTMTSANWSAILGKVKK